MTTKEEQRAKLDKYQDGFYAMYLIDAGNQSGLFRALAAHPEGISHQDLASQLGLHPPYVRVWCQTAYYFDLLDWADGLFRLAPYMGEFLSDPTNPAFFSPRVAVSRHSRFLEQHAQLMKTGQVDYDHHHHSLDRIEMMARSAERMRAPFFLSSVLPHLNNVRRLQGGGRLLDVGCGPGMFLLQLAEALPACRFVGLDISQADVDYGSTRIRERGISDQVQLGTGSAESVAFHAEFDVITMVMVFHELEGKEAAIANCYRALKPGGEFVVIDPAYPGSMPEFRNPFFKSGIMDQYFEMTWGHVHLTRPESEALLTRAGFGRPQWRYAEGGRGLYWLSAAKP